MKMTRRDFLKLSSAAAAACGVTLPVSYTHLTLPTTSRV